MGCARPGGLTLTLAARSVGMKRGRTAPPGDGSDGRRETAAASRLGPVLSSLAPCSTRICISSGEQPGVLVTKAKIARAGPGPSRNRLSGMKNPSPPIALLDGRVVSAEVLDEFHLLHCAKVVSLWRRLVAEHPLVAFLCRRRPGCFPPPAPARVLRVDVHAASPTVLVGQPGERASEFFLCRPPAKCSPRPRRAASQPRCRGCRAASSLAASCRGPSLPP